MSLEQGPREIEKIGNLTILSLELTCTNKKNKTCTSMCHVSQSLGTENVTCKQLIPTQMTTSKVRWRWPPAAGRSAKWPAGVDRTPSVGRHLDKGWDGWCRSFHKDPVYLTINDHQLSMFMFNPSSSVDFTSHGAKANCPFVDDWSVIDLWKMEMCHSQMWLFVVQKVY